MIKVLRRQYPIHAILRTGNHVILDDYLQLYSNLLNLDCDYENDVVRVDEIKFYVGVSNADSMWSYTAREYKFLPVKDKVVIDIGASIGDSSIYFALNGARKVIAIEPDPKLCQFASKNIALNGFSERIELINGICANIETIRQGIDSPAVVSLQSIIDKCESTPTILKVDCEGCEYDIILSSSTTTLLNFTHIQIEYHHGYDNLKRKLEGEGFQVRVTEPSYFISFFGNNKIKLFNSEKKQIPIDRIYSGMLYASRA